MTRSILVLSALFAGAATVMSCSSLECGPGTKQWQKSNGDSICIPVDEPASGIVCDQDAGDVTIVDGKCASRIQCDGQTAMLLPSGLCVGVAGNNSGCPVCATPAANGACVQGNIFEFTSGQQLMAGGRPLHVAVYDPVSFIENPSVMPLAETTTAAGCFALPFTPPGQAIVVAIGDPSTGAGALPPLTLAGVGAAIANGHVYDLDAFAIEKSVVDQWSTAGGVDFASKGAYVACYYDQAVPSPTMLSFNETTPTMGVKLLFDGATPADARYFDGTRAVDVTLSSTGPIGCGVAPGDGNIHSTGGTGGGVTKWETRLGGTAANVVFVDRFHSCDLSPGAASCM